MQSLSVENAGFLYIFQCIAAYSGTCFYMLLYAAAVVYFLYLAKKEKNKFVSNKSSAPGDSERGESQESFVFLNAFCYPAAALLLTVFNPIFPVAVNKLFDVNKEYYRLLWVAPVIMALSAALTCALHSASSASRAKRIILTISATLFLIGSGSFIYEGGYAKAQNPYKVKPEVIEIANLLHAISDEPHPKAICDYELEMELRQYDSSILLGATRDQYINALNGERVDEQTRQRDMYINNILDVVARNIDIDKDEFISSLEQTGTSYVIVSVASPMTDYLKSCLKEVGRTEGRTVFYYSAKEKKEPQFADYTDVWNAQAFPWSLLNR